MIICSCRIRGRLSSLKLYDLFEAVDDLRGAGGVALAHLVHQRDRVLEQRHLALERVEEAVARRRAQRLASEARPGFPRSPDRSPAGSSAASRRSADRCAVRRPVPGAAWSSRAACSSFAIAFW